MMGYSRDSFYRFKELYDKGGELALQKISHRKPVLKNRTPIEIEQAVVALAIDQSAWGRVRASEALKRRGLSISPAGVRCVRRVKLCHVELGVAKSRIPLLPKLTNAVGLQKGGTIQRPYATPDGQYGKTPAFVPDKRARN
jgi:hypothetical protein